MNSYKDTSRINKSKMIKEILFINTRYKNTGAKIKADTNLKKKLFINRPKISFNFMIVSQDNI